jgi:thiamine-monophosphate kinase
LGKLGPQGPLRRSGARPGDRIVVTGAFGGSILGRHFDFEPRVTEALALAKMFRLHAGMDISDGLALDLSRLAAESRVGAIVDTDRVPIHDDAFRLAERDGRTPLEHALGDGEDFELLLAVEPNIAKSMLAHSARCAPANAIPLTDIGEFTAEPGLWQRAAGGPVRPLTPSGWEHNLS